MKFQHIKIGQQFSYKGETYVKSTPLVASHVGTGEQKLIPRYAAIMVTDTSKISEDKNPTRNLNSKQVLIAFDTFYDCYLDSLQKLKPEIEAQTLKSFQNKLDNARQLFLNELGLQD